MARFSLPRAALSMVAAGVLGLSVASPAQPATPTPSAPGAGWAMGGHDLGNSRSNPDQRRLDASNASSLQQKWTFTTHGDVSATPAVTRGAVYFPDWGGYLNKVNASSGSLVWQRKLNTYGYNDAPDLVSRTAPAVEGQTLYLGDQGGGSFSAPRPGRVLAVDTSDGHLLWSTVINPSPFTIITQAPVVHGGVVYVGAASAEENAAAAIPGYVCCTFRGSFSALDAATGRVLWTTYMVPPATDADGPGQYSGAAIWGSTPAVDPASNTVYVTTGNNYSVPESAKQCQEAGGTPSECLAADDLLDAVVALDMTTGAIKWATGVQGFDDWIVSCIINLGGAACPPTPGPDYDFGSGPNLFTVAGPNGTTRKLVGAGAKSGIYWALDATTGQVVWQTEAGPGSTLGGIEWGTATDGRRIYVAEANFGQQPYPRNPALPHTGSFAALDPATGQILWQTPDPSGGSDLGAVSVSNGVVFAGSMTGHMYALDAATGQVLKDLPGEGSSNAGPAIDNAGNVYWGNGYARFGLGAGSNTFYAFSAKGK